jgi:hypothetical protein
LVLSSEFFCKLGVGILKNSGESIGFLFVRCISEIFWVDGAAVETQRGKDRKARRPGSGKEEPARR